MSPKRAPKGPEDVSEVTISKEKSVGSFFFMALRVSRVADL